MEADGKVAGKEGEQQPLGEPLLPSVVQRSSDDQTTVAGGGEDGDGDEYMASVTVLMLVGLVDAIEYGSVMPSLNKYMIEITGSTNVHLYGVVIAVFSATSMCIKPFIGAWCDRRSFREVYSTTISLAIIGNVVYAMAGHFGHMWMIVVGRMLSGMGAANTSLQYAYVSRTIPASKRSKVMMKAGLSFPIGMVLGPVTNIVTASFDFSITSFRVTDTNGPGLLVAAFLAVLLLLILVVVREPPPYEKSAKGRTAFADIWSELRKPAVAMCFLIIFDFNMFISASEAIVVPVTQHASNLKFTPLQNSYVYAGIAGYLITMSIILIACAGKFSDRGLVLAACAFYSAGVGVALCLWRYDMVLWEFLVGQASLLFAIPLSFSPNRALFSKQVESSKYQAVLSSLLSIMASIGSIAGPLWMSASAGGLQETGPVAPVMFYGLLGLAGASALLILLTWFSCYPPIK